MDQEFKIVAEFPFAFYGQEFTVGLSNTRRLYLPFPLMCAALGVDPVGQIQRIQRDEVYDPTCFRKATFTHYPYGTEGDYRSREVQALRLDMLPYFLGGIDTNRIADEKIRGQILRFKKEFARAAWGYFRSEVLGETELAELDDAGQSIGEQQFNAALDHAAQLRHELEERQSGFETKQLGKQKQQDREIQDLTERVAFLEAKLLTTNTLNSAQLKATQDMVAIVAKAWEKKGESGAFWKVQKSIKDQFQVHSYIAVPENRFPELRAFLLRMYKQIIRPGTPVPSIFEDPDQRSLF